MNEHTINDIIDEETDDIEVPIDQYWETAGKPIEERPEVIYLEQARSIMVIVKGKKYIYNFYDIPIR